MFLNWGKFYVWEFLVLSFMESAVLPNWYILPFFLQAVQVWSVNYEYRIFLLSSLIQKNLFQSVATLLATLCWSINYMSWISLNYKTHFRHFQKLKHHLCLRPFNLFSIKKSSILTIKYDFSFFWSCRQVLSASYTSQFGPF